MFPPAPDTREKNDTPTTADSLRLADWVRDAYEIGERQQNQVGTTVYVKTDKAAVELALREAAFKRSALGGSLASQAEEKLNLHRQFAD